jgi:diguanylate cyclase (GGDEF)-like protein
VTALGFTLLAALIVTGNTALAHGGGRDFWLFTLFLVASEFFPIQIPRRDGEITTSTTFGFALLIAFGTPAIGVMTCALIDVYRRREPLKAAFNVAQFTLAYAAAGGTLALLSNAPHTSPLPAFLPGDMPALVAAGAIFFLVNNTLVGTASALAERADVLHDLREDLGFQAATAAVLLGLAPIVVLSAAVSWAFVPLLCLPLGVIYLGGRQISANDYRALHDGLTGLPNRSLFKEHAERAIRSAQRTESVVAFLLMDLDRFKEINDTLGHHQGDRLLQEVGPRLAAVLREGDLLARLGGDEFAVLLPRLTSASQAADVAERLTAAFDPPFEIGGMTVQVSPSVGVACWPHHGADIETLVRHADVAMYLAKDAGAGYDVYSEDRDRWSPERLSLSSELRLALEREELAVYYQPQIDLRTFEVSGVEALVRWEHPTRGMQSPSEFVPVAEQSGLIKPLTLQVLNASLRQCHEWQRSGLDLTLAVNLSLRVLLDRSLPNDVANLLAKWGVDASRLQFEITEGAVISDPCALAVLEELDAMGTQISIDDFGTGYSSLAYLKRLPVHAIKVDKSFVLGMGHDADDATIVRSTIDLAHNLGLEIVAEGVEDEESLSKLVALGCDCVQGYYISQPLPGAELTPWLESPRIAGRPLPSLAPASVIPLAAARGAARVC